MNETQRPRLFDRTLENLRSAWRDIRAASRSAAGVPLRPDLPEADMRRVREQIVECLEARGGEVSARVRAAELGRTYLQLNAEGRFRFLSLLAREFGPNHALVEKAIETVRKAAAGKDRFLAEQALRDALETPRGKLFTQFTALPEGVKFLVDMRAEALDLIARDEEIMAVEADLKRLFQAWFDVGFLDLERISWDSPAAVLEKLIAYEAVHAIRSWDALKKRLESDRRLFAFFHPRMPGEPLIFLAVALVSGMASEIDALLDERAPPSDPAEADTAVFYSISNAQKGLAGINFGGFLIKQVADDLARGFPRLKIFATLSPVPGFRSWLEGALAKGELPSNIDYRPLLKVGGGDDALSALKNVLGRDWMGDRAMSQGLEEPLSTLCAHYLLEEKREDGEARDPVARFHLRNGARIERINWRADPSAKGLEQSYGMMVNYNYRLAEIEANHEAYSA
ncbi:MAG TPA: malonyl-CoA decarboxylase, partial [Alphaproteobacteria bacterium]|nr:malonyl-CoA decarboxylase [Alphaproteobacteria bacterium]